MHPCSGDNCACKGSLRPLGAFRFTADRRIKCCKDNEERRRGIVERNNAAAWKATMDLLVAEERRTGIYNNNDARV